MDQHSSPQGAITRRSIIAATGAALVGGLTGCSKPETVPVSDNQVSAKFPTTWLDKKEALKRDAAVSGGPAGAQHRLTNLINLEEGLKEAVLDGKKGFELQIKPTGYRGIPLWAVKRIELTVDGKAIPENEIVFTLDHHTYKVPELPKQVGTQWWVFDWATMFVPKAGGLNPGEHDISVRMTYTNLYGRAATDLYVVAAKERLVLQPADSYMEA